jgi:hypothetical protein
VHINDINCQLSNEENNHQNHLLFAWGLATGVRNATGLRQQFFLCMGANPKIIFSSLLTVD